MSRQEKSWDKLLRYASFATLFSMCNGQADEINLQSEMKNASIGFSELNSSCNGTSLFIVCSKLILEGKVLPYNSLLVLSKGKQREPVSSKLNFYKDQKENEHILGKY